MTIDARMHYGSSNQQAAQGFSRPSCKNCVVNVAHFQLFQHSHVIAEEPNDYKPDHSLYRASNTLANNSHIAESAEVPSELQQV